MRLLNVTSLEFAEFPRLDQRPKYVIASHRWVERCEVTLQDVRNGLNTDKSGYRKIVEFTKYVQKHVPGVEWLWVDTCCINKDSTAELSKSLNLMFEWYQNAVLCIAYLKDVHMPEDKDAFKRSEWFRRGWTLQELLAPRLVVFVTEAWQVIGSKGASTYIDCGTPSGLGLEEDIAAITGIPKRILHNYAESSGFSVEEKLGWIEGRTTTEPEDMSYALYGILGVSPGANYGEGRKGARQRLLAAVHQQDDLATRPVQDRAEPPPTASSSVPFRRDGDYVSREDITAQMHAKLSVPGGRAALVGIGGVGKSQLAIEYSYRLRERSPGTWVLWIHASNAARFEQSMREVAELMQVRGRQEAKTEIFQLVSAWLRDSRKGRWLVILDNADDADFLLEPPVTASNTQWLRRVDYLPVCDHGSILVTSRSIDEAVKLVERSEAIMVGPMDPVSARLLLEKKLNEQMDKKGITELAEALGWIPLALTQAAAYIAQRGRRYSIGQYVEKVRRSESTKKSILAETAGDHRRDREAQNSILVTWEISFDHIYQVRRSAAELLSLMSFCDRQSIPASLIRCQHDGVANKAESGESATRTGRTNLGEDSCSVDNDSNMSSNESDDWANESFDRDIAILEGYSFVSTTANNISTFEMHGLVQHATQRWLLSRSQLERYADQYVDRLCRMFPPGKYENWSDCQTLFPHVRSMMESRPHKQEAALQWASVMYNAAWYAWTQGNIVEAVKMSSSSLQVRKKQLGTDAAETLSSKAMLALSKKDGGRWGEAEELEVKVIEARSRTLGEQHPDTLMAIGNLVLTYHDQGRGKEAEELGVKVMEARSRTLGEQHPDTLIAVGNLALTYQKQGRWKEAEELEVKVMEARSRTLGEQHPDTLMAIGNLALTYHNQGRWKEAEELGVKVIEARSKTLGDEHRYTLIAIGNLASIYRDQGRWKEAEELEVKVMEARSKTLGDEHPDTLTAIGNLALTYHNQGRWKEAEELEVKVMEARSKTLGDEHPDTLTAMANLTSTYHNQGRWKEAEELLVKVMEARSRTLGEQHPDTLTAIGNLASTYHSQGRWKEAEELEVKVIEARSRTLGDEHPDTLTAMANLASTYQKQGRWKEAEELGVKVMEARSRTLGDEHPDTLTAMANLASTYWNQGWSKEADDLLFRAVDSCERVLGKGHPNTVAVVSNLQQLRSHRNLD